MLGENDILKKTLFRSLPPSNTLTLHMPFPVKGSKTPQDHWNEQNTASRCALEGNRL